MNSSGITPHEFKVLVRPDKVEEKTKGGIIIPETERDREQHAATQGTLIAMSPLAWTFAEWPKGAKTPEIGDHVIFPRYVGFMVKGDDDEDYWLLNDKDILAVRNGVNGA